MVVVVGEGGQGERPHQLMMMMLLLLLVQDVVMSVAAAVAQHCGRVRRQRRRRHIDRYGGQLQWQAASLTAVRKGGRHYLTAGGGRRRCHNNNKNKADDPPVASAAGFGPAIGAVGVYTNLLQSLAEVAAKGWEGVEGGRGGDLAREEPCRRGGGRGSKLHLQVYSTSGGEGLGAKSCLLLRTGCQELANSPELTGQQAAAAAGRRYTSPEGGGGGRPGVNTTPPPS